MSTIDYHLMRFLDSPVRVGIAALVLLLVLVGAVHVEKTLFYFRFIVKSLRRNILRSLLTSLATVVLVLVGLALVNRPR